MDAALQKYLQSVKQEAEKYKNNKLQTKEYLESMNNVKEWLKEQCDADSRN